MRVVYEEKCNKFSVKQEVKGNDMVTIAENEFIEELYPDEFKHFLSRWYSMLEPKNLNAQIVTKLLEENDDRKVCWF